jgi:hypothetical protein
MIVERVRVWHVCVSVVSERPARGVSRGVSRHHGYLALFNGKTFQKRFLVLRCVVSTAPLQRARTASASVARAVCVCACIQCRGPCLLIFDSHTDAEPSSLFLLDGASIVKGASRVRCGCCARLRVCR